MRSELGALLVLASVVQGFVFGLNMPWNSCGNDFGADYDSAVFELAFAKYSANGAKVVRIWDHYDGSKSLELYSNGYFRVLPQVYFDNLKDMLSRAKNHGLQVLFSIFSFECVNNQNCKGMIEDQGKQDAYIQNGLEPFLDFISQQQLHNQVFAVELFNEPEWMVTGGAGVSSTTSLSAVQQLVTKANKVITTKGYQATIGSAGLKWTCNCGHWCEGDWWGNTGISFYQVHYYDWMVSGGNTFDPFNTSPSDWCLYKPVLIGESPAWTSSSLKGQMTVPNQYWLANQRGYIGVLPWSDKADGNYSDIMSGLKCQWDMASCRPSFEARKFLSSSS